MVQQLREHARDIQNHVTRLQQLSCCLPGDTVTTAVADGNWVFLKPLAPGEHELSFKGFVKESVSSRDDRSAYDIDLRKDSFDFPSGWNHMATYKLSITI